MCSRAVLLTLPSFPHAADSTMGTIFNVLALGIYENVATTLRFPQLGDYGSPPDLFIWSFQLFVFLSIIAINKGLLVLLFSAYKYDLDAFICGAFTSVQAHPELELVLVMIVIPLCCNRYVPIAVLALSIGHIFPHSMYPLIPPLTHTSYQYLVLGDGHLLETEGARSARCLGR